MLRQPLKMYLICYVLSLIYEVFLPSALILDLFFFFSKSKRKDKLHINEHRC
jgi:hypothetical protein